jgi:mono/diheme cytochrome c family protein
MWSRIAGVAVAGAALFLAGCDPGRHSAAGFRLADGDAARGKQAFLDLQCYQCHEVAGTDLPKPAVQPPVPVQLGGTIAREKTDGYLATAILNPSHAIAGYPKEMVMVNNQSRMPDNSDKITLRQLSDLVAFLQSTYVVRPPQMNRFAY